MTLSFETIIWKLKMLYGNHKLMFLVSVQKQPFAGVLQNRCSLKFRKIH